MAIRIAKFQIGDIVRHRVYTFRGVIFDVDPEFANTEVVEPGLSAPKPEYFTAPMRAVSLY